MTFNGPNEGYQVTVTRTETNSVIKTISTQDTSINITELEIYEFYNVSVVALSDKGPGDSADITILTDEDSELGNVHSIYYLVYFISSWNGRRIHCI